MLWLLGALDLGETAPPSASPFLEIAKGLSRSTSLIYKPASPLFTAPGTPYPTLTHQANISPTLNHPRARVRQLETTSIAPNHQNYSNCPLSCLPCPTFPFLQKPQQSVRPRPSPRSFLPPEQHWCLLLGPYVACADPPSGTCDYNKLPFKPGSRLLWPHPTSTFLEQTPFTPQGLWTPLDSILIRNCIIVSLKDQPSPQAFLPAPSPSPPRLLSASVLHPFWPARTLPAGATESAPAVSQSRGDSTWLQRQEGSRGSAACHRQRKS